jgi:putative membrane protein
VSDLPDGYEPDVRFSLANERTLLAYQRTAIGLIAGAVAVLHFLDSGDRRAELGAVLLACGAIATVGGYWRYLAADRAIRAGRPLPNSLVPLLLTAGIAISLIVAVAYLFDTL